MQAKDIPTEQIMELVLACNEARCDYGPDAGYHGGRPGYAHDPSIEPKPHWANLYDIDRALGVPEKVLLAKLRKMVRRGELDGCACGCRGDFIVPGSPADYRVGKAMATQR